MGNVREVDGRNILGQKREGITKLTTENIFALSDASCRL